MSHVLTYLSLCHLLLLLCQLQLVHLNLQLLCLSYFCFFCYRHFIFPYATLYVSVPYSVNAPSVLPLPTFVDSFPLLTTTKLIIVALALTLPSMSLLLRLPNPKFLLKMQLQSTQHVKSS